MEPPLGTVELLWLQQWSQGGGRGVDLGDEQV
jgi:hypothetical protein